MNRSSTWTVDAGHCVGFTSPCTARPPRRHHHTSSPRHGLRHGLSQTRASAAPRDFVRVYYAPSGAVELQTKVTRFVRKDSVNEARIEKAENRPDNPCTISSVDLYTVVHHGSMRYYNALNDVLERNNYDAVYFELITSATNVRRDANSRLDYLVRDVNAPLTAVQIARRLGCVAQVDALDMSTGWIADLRSEEIADVEAYLSGPEGENRSAQGSVNPETMNGERAGSESSGAVSFWRKLFRSMLLLLPCPELHMVFADIVLADTNARLMLPTLFSLARGDLSAARRMAYAVSVESSTAQFANTQLCDGVTLRRNARVVEALQTGVKNAGFAKVAVVYGAWHGDNLSRLIERQLGLGFGSAEWITALVVENATTGRPWSRFWANWTGAPGSADDNAQTSAYPIPLASLGAILAGLLGLEVYAAIDWAQLLTAFVRSVELAGGIAMSGDAVLEAALYVLRHTSMYLFFRSWITRSSSTP